jgi:chromosome segregation ATPase
MNYVFVLDKNGIRETSYVVGLHAETLEETEQLAKQTYPSANIVTGDSEMQEQFTSGKAYINGGFVDIPVTAYESTKSEKIAEIKAYYDKRFETLEQMVLRRRLINGDISDLQEQYKKLNMEMLAKIKAVK